MNRAGKSAGSAPTRTTSEWLTVHSFSIVDRTRTTLFYLTLALAATGCVNLQGPQRDHLASTDIRLAECAVWFKALDAAVAQNAVNDIAARPMPGFPYLRIDRFLASMKSEAKQDLQRRRAWVDAMRARDADGRRVEIANLSAARVAELGVGKRTAVETRTQDCAERLMTADLGTEAAIDELYRRAFVADDYSSAKRALGLYELTRLPFYAGVSGWQEDTAEIFSKAGRGELTNEQMRRYLPPQLPVFSRQQVSEILARAAEHPLGLAQLSPVQRRQLFATYAPVLEIETHADFDRIGRLYWSSNASPQVDVSQPVVYHRLGYTRVGGRTLLQLVYVAWFPERPIDGSFDVLGGHLDGVVWRVTLAADGEPLLFDSIHPCGCYHMFFPTPRLEPLPPPQHWTEWAFIPASLPAVAESQRLVVEVQSRSHYLRNVSATTAPGNGTTYQFAEYGDLRSLPLPQGGSRSVFGPDGLITGSERGERYLFWPMGIKSPGAMRQAGSQATAFVGRRHFDDADLVDKRFRLRDE
jgi:hypothetical protein